MKKFEPGDLIIGKSEADDEYSITKAGTIWKVLEYESEDYVRIGTHFTSDPNDYREFDVEDQYFDKLPFKLGDVITFTPDTEYKFKVISLASYDGPEPYNNIKLRDLYTGKTKYYDTTEFNFMKAKVIIPADLQQSSFNIENDDRDLL